MVTAFYGTPPSDEERLKFLDRAYELGCTHWDSAAMYGDNEELLGRWFEQTGKRSAIFLTTKFGNHVTPEGGREIRNDPEYIRQSVNDSLKKLKTDYIDLLYWYESVSSSPTFLDALINVKIVVIVSTVKSLLRLSCKR
jgi:aryl-alcohol dehydrogenase-like predicted oxidoreductase